MDNVLESFVNTVVVFLMDAPFIWNIRLPKKIDTGSLFVHNVSKILIWKCRLLMDAPVRLYIILFY